MGCGFRLRLNTLHSIWYTVFFTVLQAYLLWLGFERYRLYTEMKWPHGAYPRIWLTVYISLYAFCIPALLLYLIFGVFKTGNLAGDNDRLAGRSERIVEITRGGAPRPSCSPLHCLKSTWQHSPPLPQTLHLVLALCQLVAQQVMLAQLYRFGFINSGDFLNTELDFVYQRARLLATNLPMGDTRLQSFRITTEELADSPQAPNLLPILMHARLFGIPLEFVNFFVALLAYACAYPAVFWRVNKCFSLWFSLYLLFHVVSVIWTYLSFSVLFRIQETSYYSLRPVGLGTHLAHTRSWMIYHPLAILGCFVATIFFMHLAPIAFYAYGYNQYYVRQLSVQARNASSRTASAGGTDYGDVRRPKTRNNSSSSSSSTEQSGFCCDGYGSHLLAILFLVLIFVIKAPTLYALVLLYQREQKALLLSCITVDVVYLLSGFVFWLIMLIVLKRWRFSVIHRVEEILSLQDAHRTANGNVHNKKPSELKNALVLMHGDHMYVTDDPLAKQSMLRQAVRNNANEDVYWLRANQSPSTRKVPLNEGKGTPEMTRLLGPSMRRSSNAPGSPVPMAGPPYEQGSARQSHQRVDRFPSNDGTVNTFGTLKRVSHDTGYGTQSSVPYGPRSPVPGRAHQPADSYASIHKNGNSRLSQSDLVERRSSAQNEYGQMGGTYSNSGTMYATYGRSAPYRSPNYATYNGGPNGGIVGQRQSSEPIGGTGQSSVKASPLLMDRQNANISGRVGFREQSPYAPRSAMKLASFNGHGEKIYGQLVNGDQWNSVDEVLAQHSQPQQVQSIQQQRPTVISMNAQKPPPPNQHAPNGHWNPANNYTKLGTLSASSSGQQDGGSYTPSSSTMTSQGSSSYSTQEHTPAAGSPTGATAGSHPALYDNADVTLTRDAVQSLKNTLNAHAAARNGTNPNGLRPAIKTATISVDAREDVYGDYSNSTNRGPAKFGQINGGGDEFATSVV